MRVVLDTNILVRAAWLPDGLASRLLRAVIDSPHRLIVSPFILGEVSRVLDYPRLQARWNLTPLRIQAYVNQLAAASDIVDTPASSRVVPDDPDDDFIVQTAIVGRADFLCTRDMHLLIPQVVDYCLRHGVRLVNDIALYHVLTGRPPGSVS